MVATHREVMQRRINREAKQARKDRRKRLNAAAPDLLAELRSVEWVHDDEAYGAGSMNRCPACLNMENMGHAHGCTLNAAIAKATQEGA